MSFTIQRCILSKCRGSINFNACREICTTFISWDRTLVKPLFAAKLNLLFNRNNFLHTNNVRYETTPSNIKAIPHKITNNYPGTQLKKRPKKRKNIFSNNDETVGVCSINPMFISHDKLLYLFYDSRTFKFVTSLLLSIRKEIFHLCLYYKRKN